MFGPSEHVELYSNQFVPLWFDTDIITKARIDGKALRRLSGGGISHLNMERELTVDQLMAFIKFAAKVGLEHYAFNPFLTYCENGHATIGREKRCKVCGSENVRNMTRIVGYFTDVSSWIRQRRDEFWKRKVVVKDR